MDTRLPKSSQDFIRYRPYGGFTRPKGIPQSLQNRRSLAPRYLGSTPNVTLRISLSSGTPWASMSIATGATIFDLELPRKWHPGKMTNSKFRSGASRNKYGFSRQSGNETCIICFSEAEKFAVIFPAALTLSLILSFVSRRKKVWLSKD